MPLFHLHRSSYPDLYGLWTCSVPYQLTLHPSNDSCQYIGLLCGTLVGKDGNRETKIGGAEGIRTPDLLRAREALSQLSYSPRMSYLWILTSPSEKFNGQKASL